MKSPEVASEVASEVAHNSLFFEPEQIYTISATQMLKRRDAVAVAVGEQVFFACLLRWTTTYRGLCLGRSSLKIFACYVVALLQLSYIAGGFACFFCLQLMGLHTRYS